VWHLARDARDSTTGPHDGTPTGTTTVTGKIGSALSFDGTSAFVDIADASAFDFGLGTDFTISMWMLSSQAASPSAPHLLSKRDATQGYDLLLHSANASDAWSGVVTSSGASAAEHGRTNVADGAWHLVTLVRQGTSLIAYEDSAAASPTAITSGDLANTVALRLGAQAGATATQLYQGNEDEVRISSIARGPDWILTDFANQSAPGSFVVVGPEVAP
jgi:hypothetical protein